MIELLIVIGVIAWAISSSSSRKKRREREARAARTAFGPEQAAAPASQQAQRRAPAAPTVRPTVRPAQPKAAPHSAPKRPHVVQPSRATGHAHTESSMSGAEPCPPDLDRPLSARRAAFKAAKDAARRAAEGPRREGPPPEGPRPEGPRPADAMPAAPVVRSAASLRAAAAAPFQFDPARVRDGLIYAEILGKPKALRRGRGF